MAPDPTVATRLARLLREADLDVAALDARASETATLVERWTASGELPRPELVLVAVNLHGYYTALEALFERVAKLLDDEIPGGAAWHVELVAQMQAEVPELRPALLPSALASDVHALRKFRHFFRNAYVLELDPTRVREHAARVGRIHGPLLASLRAFRQHLVDLQHAS